MRVGIDARRGEITLSIVRGLSPFSHDQADARALRVVLGGQLSRRAVEPGAAAGHRRHDQTVLQFQPAEANGRKQSFKCVRSHDQLPFQRRERYCTKQEIVEKVGKSDNFIYVDR